MSKQQPMTREGANMADIARTNFHVDPNMIEAIRNRHGLVDAADSTVMQYALALACGQEPDPVAYMPHAWAQRARLRREAEQAEQRRDAERRAEVAEELAQLHEADRLRREAGRAA